MKYTQQFNRKELPKLFFKAQIYMVNLDKTLVYGKMRHA